jgi:hypothetical protein
MSYELNEVELNIKVGTKHKGTIEIGPYFLHNLSKIRKFVRIPYTIINGEKKGPKLCITAGVHGTEYAGITAAIKIINEVDPKKIQGTIVIIPVVNMPAYEKRSYICPIDGVNLQGSWPGNIDASIGPKICYRIFNEIVSKSNFWLDLHGADTHESEIAFSHYYITGDSKIDMISEGMAKALMLEYNTISKGSLGKGCSYRVGPEYGIPTALCEMGQGDKLLLEESETAYKGILNVMKYLGIYDGQPVNCQKQKILNTQKIGVNEGGLFYTNAKPGAVFSKGEIIGHVKDLNGRILETIYAPSDGIILLMIHNPVLDAGEKIITWGIL